MTGLGTNFAEKGEFVNRAGVSRQTLAHSSHEGLVVALAGAIVAAPKAGDDQLIVLTPTTANYPEARSTKSSMRLASWPLIPI